MIMKHKAVKLCAQALLLSCNNVFFTLHYQIGFNFRGTLNQRCKYKWPGVLKPGLTMLKVEISFP